MIRKKGAVMQPTTNSTEPEAASADDTQQSVAPSDNKAPSKKKKVIAPVSMQSTPAEPAEETSQAAPEEVQDSPDEAESAEPVTSDQDQQSSEEEAEEAAPEKAPITAATKLASITDKPKTEEKSDSEQEPLSGMKIEGLGLEKKDVKGDGEAELDQNAAKVYDTKEYHLPIKANNHHKKGSIPHWFIIAVLLLANAGVAAYYFLVLEVS